VRTKLTVSLLVLLLTVSFAFAAEVDQIIDQNLEAKGGKAAWQELKSVRLKGAMRVEGGAAGAVEMPFVVEMAKPDKVRIEFTMQGMTAVQAFDGEVGWAIMPFLGKTEPEQMDETQLKQVKSQGDLGGPLVNYKDKGHTIELLGNEEVDGTAAIKLKLTRANGDVDFIYLDEEYFVEFKSESQRTIQGAETTVQTVYGDYKEVGGLMFAHSMEVSYGAGPGRQVVTISSIETNLDLPDERFAMPAAAPKAE